MFRTVLVPCLLAMMLSTAGCMSNNKDLVAAVQPNSAELSEKQDFHGMTVQFLAISEGEATLITFSQGYTLLIDAGSAKSGDEVADFLEQNHVKKIDLLVLTGDMDEHIGGANEILSQFPVEQVMLPAAIKETITDEVQAPMRSVLAVEEGEAYPLPQEAKIRILHPGDPLSLTPQANSLVLQLIHGNIKWLFTSDITEEVEHELMEKYNLKSQFLKVSDSASNLASSPQFLKKVDPHAAVIFSDDEKVIGFDEVLERLHETWIDVYQTKNHGTIRVLSDSKDYRIERDKVKGYFDAR